MTALDNKIPTPAIEFGLIQAAQRLWSFQQSLGIQPPLVVMVTLTGVKGYVLTAGASATKQIDRDILRLPEIITEEANPDIPRLLRPIFDALWQAAGWNECKHYQPDGTWKPRP